MQKEGIIDRYTIVPNWKRIGLATEFIILAEADNDEQLLEIEKKHVIIADEYTKENENFVVTPTISGCVILQIHAPNTPITVVFISSVIHMAAPRSPSTGTLSRQGRNSQWPRKLTRWPAIE